MERDGMGIYLFHDHLTGFRGESTVLQPRVYSEHARELTFRLSLPYFRSRLHNTWNSLFVL